MSCNSSNEENPSNIPEILVTFDKFQFEISGKFLNDAHLPNKEEMFFILLVFHFDIFGKIFNEEY